MSSDGRNTAFTAPNGRPIPKPGQEQRSANAFSSADLNLIDMLSHFNRERIPERVVHAKGAGAYGEFEVYQTFRVETSRFC